jgi:septum site-determining protein MinC
MAVAPAGNPPAVFDLKSASLPLLALLLRSTDPAALAQALAERYGDTPDVFDHEPVVLDLSGLADDTPACDFAPLLALVRQYKMVPVAVKGGPPAVHEAAVAAGLVSAPDAVTVPGPQSEPEVLEVVKEVIREVPVPTPVAGPGTLVIDRPLRSGQQVYAKGADLVVLAAVNFGAEVIADGHVHVYAPLRGKAIAGARGNTEARIFTTCLEPELISIAGIYRTTETAIPDEVLGKPAQVRLVGEKLVMEPLKS